jgi:hypothetical protein
MYQFNSGDEDTRLYNIDEEIFQKVSIVKTESEIDYDIKI